MHTEVRPTTSEPQGSSGYTRNQSENSRTPALTPALRVRNDGRRQKPKTQSSFTDGLRARFSARDPRALCFQGGDPWAERQGKGPQPKGLSDKALRASTQASAPAMKCSELGEEPGPTRGPRASLGRQAAMDFGKQPNCSTINTLQRWEQGTRLHMVLTPIALMEALKTSQL